MNERPKSVKARESRRPATASSCIRSSSPSSSLHIPELNISGVSAISSLSRHDSTSRAFDRPSRQEQLDKNKTYMEAKQMEYGILLAKALIAEAGLTWAPPPDLRENQTKKMELKKKISEITMDIEMILDFNEKVAVLLEAQSAANQAQARLDLIKTPPQDHVKTLEEFVNHLKGCQLVSNVRLPEGDETEGLKSRLEQLFSREERRVIENARKYAEHISQLSENLKNIELASNKLTLVEKEKEMWERHAESLQESLDFATIWREEFQRKNPKGL